MAAVAAIDETDALVAPLFEEGSRAAAVAGSLPILASYFASGESWKLQQRWALGSDSDDLDRVLAQALRLRVLLALGRQLEPILHVIADNPSFRYRQRSDESVGLIAGRLDIQRHVRERGQVPAPRRYQVRITERQVATPENVLAAGALTMLSNALAGAPAEILPRRSSPERREVADLRASLLRLQQLPLFAHLREQADHISKSGRLRRQRHEVLRRLQRRDIASAQPYRELADWVGDFLSGVAPISGPFAWTFYDERFDARLFELWTLAQLYEALVALVGTADAPLQPMWSTTSGPWAVWSSPFGVAKLFFQREAASFGATARWKTETGHTLRAIPDLALLLMPGHGIKHHFLIDCKLRRRDPLSDGASGKLDLPSNEIYKMLGYFEHLRGASEPQGALVYYTPTAASASLMVAAGKVVDGDTGALLLAGTDPAVDCSEVFGKLAERIASRLGLPTTVALAAAGKASAQAIDEGLDEIEVKAAYKQALMTGLIADYSKVHASELPALEKLTSHSFGDGVWEALDEETHRMILSAELYGSHQGEALDHSGPLLGLCAACERELNRRLYAPAQAASASELRDNGQPVLGAHPTLGAAQWMLGKAIRILKARAKSDPQAEKVIIDEAPDHDSGRAWQLVANYLEALKLDLQALKEMSDQLRKLNQAYRRLAAHDEVIETDVWAGGRDVIFGRGRLVNQIATLLPEPVSHPDAPTTPA